MRKQIKKSFVVLSGIVLTVSMLALPVRADQPFMRAAKTNLENALKFLEKASADKGGHRANAMLLTSRAIIAVNNGIAYDQQHPSSSGVELDDHFANPDMNSADQINMIKAGQSLRTAIGALKRASDDKGGYRKQALDIATEALAEVNSGIEYDRKH